MVEKYDSSNKKEITGVFFQQNLQQNLVGFNNLI